MITENQRKKKKKKKRLAFFLILTYLIVFFSGYGIGLSNSDKNISGKTEQSEEENIKEVEATEESAKEVSQEKEEAEEKEQNKTVEKIMNDMTLSEMVYQMMFVTPESITGVGQAVQAGEGTKQALLKYPVGGIIYFSQNFQSREQTVEMIKNTQNYSKIPLFISVDEEGGRVSRLGSNPQMGTTKHPPMLEIGNTKDAKKAYAIGEMLAKELTEIGFNVDFAPDSDVLINSENKEIGDRSFGSDPQNVAMMVQSIVSGMQENGLSATLKHFPGHGSTYVDSHTGYSESTRTIEELRNSEFLPFISGINAGADFIMISHMTLINAVKEKVPASVSKEVITDMLKNELGYSGIIITDSFRMGAITDKYTASQAAVKAVKAGVDMILMTPDITSAHSAIVAAVKSGEISEDRIKESVRKIISLKVEKGMFE